MCTSISKAVVDDNLSFPCGIPFPIVIHRFPLATLCLPTPFRTGRQGYGGTGHGNDTDPTSHEAMQDSMGEQCS
jgi:hypothetical protein